MQLREVAKDEEIIERGTRQELLGKRGFYHHLYASQFKGQVEALALRSA